MKSKPLSFYKKKLWRIFSEYIRRKYSDGGGMAICVSCGIQKPWKEIHAGHYIPKSAGLSIYFEEKNVHPQCAGCNTFRHGNLSEYALALKRLYGPDILEELDAKRNTPIKYSKADYLELIDVYTGKLAGLDF